MHIYEIFKYNKKPFYILLIHSHNYTKCILVYTNRRIIIFIRLSKLYIYICMYKTKINYA